MLIKTNSGGYKIVPDKEAIDRAFYRSLCLIERIATFFLGFVFCLGLLVQGFKTLTVKRAELVKIEQVKPVKHRVKKRGKKNNA